MRGHRDSAGPTGPLPPGTAAGSRGSGPRSFADEAAAAIAGLEGYLLAHQARTEAAQAGAAFARRFPWLGPQEEAEIARVFAQEHLALRRRMLQAAAGRAEELRREYRQRYACLRRRLVASVLGLVAGAAAVLSAVLSAVVRGAG
ncbi:hypothetical protein [Streptomyces tritici]|uniref:hypothetical protein n=1 Tax=Streptomyces tritici TaxID=2054410 RepID=UPI003AEF6505